MMKNDILYTRIEQLLTDAKKRRSLSVIAIDGRCGAGKSTLAEQIAERYGCSIVHMDDFFLPVELRSEERLQEPGGNVHYERFKQEIVIPLTKLKSIFDPAYTLDYRRFDCAVMRYADRPCHISFSPASPLLVVEGSYSMRPEFRVLYDCTIFLTHSSTKQAERIIKRSGQERYPMFRDKWIPLEQKYFDYYEIAEHAEFVIDTDSLVFPLLRS